MLDFVYGALIGFGIICGCATVYLIWLVIQIVSASNRINKEWGPD